MRYLPQSVQLVHEDQTLLRIVEVGGDVVDVELNENQLLGLITQGAKIVRDHYAISKLEAKP